MKIINDLNMPEHAFAAICLRQGRLEPPKLDHIGVGTLIGAPLPRYLFARYWHQLEVNASDTMNAIQGQFGHLLFDKVETTTISKVPLRVEFEGTTILGEADYYDPLLLTLGDNKFKQVNSVTAGNISKDDYLEKQLNIYCWMARRQGLKIEYLQGDIYINGWTRYKTLAGSNYPKKPYVKIRVPIWEDSFTTNYVRKRIAVHDTRAIKMLRDLGVNNIPVIENYSNYNPEGLNAAMMEIPICTDKERFAQPTIYAVMKEGQKKAVKLFDHVRDAWEYVTIQTPAMASKMNVVERKGGYIKCAWYCDTRMFCPYNRKAEKELDLPAIEE